MKARNVFAALSPGRAWGIIVAYLVLMVVAAVLVSRYVDQESLRSVVAGTGSLGVAVFLVIEYLYVIFVPIYNTAIHLAAGYIFGGQLGWVLNFVATTAGLITIIWLVRVYGQPLLKKIINKEFLDRYSSVVNKLGPIILFVVYVLPLFPDDEVTYLIAAGGGSSFWRFILPVLLGNIAKTATSYIGDEGVSGFTMAIGARIVVLVVGLIIIGTQEWLVLRKQPSR